MPHGTPAAHYLSGYSEFDGIMFPIHRKVLPRGTPEGNEVNFVASDPHALHKSCRCPHQGMKHHDQPRGPHHRQQ